MTAEPARIQSTALAQTDPDSLSSEFWPAFVTLVNDLGQAGDLDCRFGFQISCGNNGGCDPDALSRGVHQRFERFSWPVTEPAALRPRDILDLVEFFYECVAFPAWDICSFCEQSHVVAGDSAIAREKYTGAINVLFRRFDLPLTLRDGKVDDTSNVSSSITASAAGVSQALDDADLLAQSHRASHAVVPVFAALHGYMRAACDAVDSESVSDTGAGMGQLFGYLQEHHPALRNSSGRPSDVEGLVRTLCDALDALFAIRQRSAVAGPGDGLDEAEAMLAVNAGRAVFVYLDARLQIRDGHDASE